MRSAVIRQESQYLTSIHRHRLKVMQKKKVQDEDNLYLTFSDIVSGSNNKKKNTNSSKLSSSQASDEYPTAFYCPISHCLMLEPVMDREGNTYERTSIEQWLNKHNTSPITRNFLTVNHLVVNRALVDLIGLELKRRGDQPELEKRKVWQQQRDQKRRDSLPRVCLSESDILARVEAAENKITIHYTNGGVLSRDLAGGVPGDVFEVFVGQLNEDSKKHGYGKCTSLTWIFVGHYKDDKQDGNGILTFADGGKYVGEYKNGYEDGNGTYTWPNGGKYVGEYKNGKRHGHGTETFADGTICHSGEWVNNKPIVLR